MQQRPLIKTAIPKHRYQIGDYSASLLGEIESGDARQFRYILAFVRMGQSEPGFYVCAEAVPARERPDGAYRLLVISEAMAETLDQDDRWGDLDTFSDQALRLGAQALGLQRDQVVRLM